MVTLTEYEIYLKVKKFIETEGCDESSIVLLLTNGVGIIPAYVPLIIESKARWGQLPMETRYTCAPRVIGKIKKTLLWL